MNTYQRPERNGYFQISKHEKERLSHLFDLADKTHPSHLEKEDCDIYCDDCRSAGNANGILLECHDQDLWEFHDKVECATRFILRQILISHNRSPSLVKKITKVSIITESFTFDLEEDGEERFYMSLSGIDD